MKRPNLMVTKIVRKRHKTKKLTRLPESTSVKYFNSLPNRTYRLSPPVATVYEEWTANIRKSMEKENLWPKGTEKWTYTLVIEYIKRLQSEFWRSQKLNSTLFFKRNFSEQVSYLMENNEKYRFSIKVFNIIYYKKLKRYTASQKICRLPIQYWCITPLYTYTYKYERFPSHEKAVMEARFEKFY